MSYIDKRWAPSRTCLHQVVHLCKHHHPHNIHWLSYNKVHLMKMSYYIFLLRNLVHNDFPNSRVQIRLGMLVNNFENTKIYQSKFDTQNPLNKAEKG